MKRNAIRIGPLIAIFVCVSYFTIFSQYPITRDFPWINFPLVIVGLLLSLVALLGWQNSGSFKRLLLVCGSAISVFFAGLLFLYVFVISSQMPIPKIPGFSKDPTTLALKTTGNRSISMNDLSIDIGSRVSCD